MTTATEVPFSRLDHAIVASERRWWPMTVHLEARFARHLDPDRLSEAIRAAIGLHPKAGQRELLRSGWRSTQSWELPAVLDVAPLTVAGVAPDRFVSRPIPLGSAPPLRALLVPGDDGDTLVLSTHHGAFDALSALTVLRAVAAAYGGIEPPRPPDDPAADMTDSSVGGTGRAGLLSLLPAAVTALRAGGGRLAPAPGARPDDGYGISWLELGPPPDGHRGTATVNDLLVAGLHLAADRWNRRAGRRTASITVAVPVDERTPGNRGAVGNFAGEVIVVSTPETRRSTAFLVQAVSEQMSAARERRSVDHPLAALGAASWLPVGVRMRTPRILSALTGDRALATTRLSNLGRQDAPELTSTDLQARSLWFSPPTRPPQGLVLGVVTFGGVVRVAARWCRGMFDERSGRAFLDLFAASVTEAAESARKP